MIIKLVEGNFVICKVENYNEVNLESDFVFTAKTDEEKSLVCKVDDMPNNIIEKDEDWSCVVVDGVLDFSLVGIIAKISEILKNIGVSLFVVSTYNTDYILVKKENLEKALGELEKNGYEIKR